MSRRLEPFASCSGLAVSLVLVLSSLTAPGIRAEGTGLVRVAGSTLLEPLVERWAEQLATRGIEVSAEARGSATGPPALLSGRADVATLRRPMAPAEIEAFRRSIGYEPIAVPVALSAVAVFVNAENPLGQLTLLQLDGVFSATRRCGGSRALRTWGDLGLAEEWEDRAIGLYGPSHTSPSAALMGRVALCRGAFRDDLRETPGAASVVRGIAEARFGIGYGDTSRVSGDVKVLSLARSEEGPWLRPIREDVVSGAYPLTRTLMLYVLRSPGEPLPPPVAEFIRHARSDEGQAVVTEAGYWTPPGSIRDNRALR